MGRGVSSCVLVAAGLGACADRSTSHDATTTASTVDSSTSADVEPPPSPVPGTDSGGGSTDGSSTGAPPPACVPEVSFGPFELLTPEPMGSIQRYDVDGDTRTDLFGNGVVVYQRDDAIEIDDTFPATGGRGIGHFDAVAGLDVLGGNQNHVRVYSGLVVGDTWAQSPITHFASADIADVDADGIDDLLVTRSNNRPQLWLGTASGVFELSTTFELWHADVAAFTKIEPPRLDIVIRRGGLHWLVGDGTGQFTQVQEIMGAPLSVRPHVAPTPSGDWFADAWSIIQLTTNTGASLTRLQPNADPIVAAIGWNFGDVGSVAAADLDDDGFPELFVERSEGSDEITLEVACHAGNGQLQTCGSVSRPGYSYSHELAIVERDGGFAVVQSLTEHGTSIASIEVTPCE